MDEDISEEEYQEWDQSLRLVEKDGVRVEWNSNGDCFEHREGNSLKSMNSQNGQFLSSKTRFPSIRRNGKTKTTIFQTV